MMLMVGIPLLLKAKVQLKKKILLVGIFSLGIFVVLAAVLNKYFNFSNPLTTIYMLWYIRESSVAIYVSNTPMLWPLARKVFNAGSFAGSSGGGGYGQTGSKGSKGSGAELSKIRRASRAKQEDIESSPGSTNDSTEQINKMQISTRLSFTIEDARHSPINPNGYDVERNGDSSYKASVISGGNHVPSKS